MEGSASTREDRELVREADAVRQARLARVRALTPTERIERLHALCAQAAAMRSASRHGAP